MPRLTIWERYGVYPIAGGSPDGDEPLPPPPSPPTPPAPGDGDRKFSQADLDRIVSARLAEEKQRQEARDRKTADDAEAKRLADQQEYQKLAEREKARADAAEAQQAEAQTQRRRLALDYEVQLLTAKLGLVDAEAALLLVDPSQLQYGADDKPTNLEALLGALVEAKPWLKAEAPSTGGGGSPPTPRPNRQPETEAERVARYDKRLQSSGADSRL
jgi:hypothetical protein